MKNLFIILILFSLLFSCQNGSKTDVSQQSMQEEVADSSALSEAETDSVELALPSEADGLFDDFIYGYMHSRKRQLERTKFPLRYIVDGKVGTIEKSEWKHTKLFSDREVYTIVFDNDNQEDLSKDASIDHVTFEWIYLSQQRIKQYLFRKQNGQWFLTEVNEHSLKEDVNGDFYSFYKQFSTSDKYQMEHVANPFKFKTYDYDNYETIEGTLDAVQWADFRPELPYGTITNIKYGDPQMSADKRMLFLTNVSGGMDCELYFVKKNGSWVLVRLNN